MNHDSDIGVKAPKDVDSELMSRFLRAFFMSLLFLLFLFIVLFGVFWGFVIAFIASLITALFVTFLSEKAAIVLKIIYGDRKSKISKREQMVIKLKTVRYAKMQKDFKTALNIVNEILEKDPQFYEAKFVKAQILEEGFGMTENAKGHLSNTIRNTGKDESVHQWAKSFYMGL